MKILGLTYYRQEGEIFLKPDSALLNNDKPFFLPAFSKQLYAIPAIALRINRLGRNVQQKFAYRYFDAWAPAINIINADSLNFIEQTAIDNSLPIGSFKNIEAPISYSLHINNQQLQLTDQQLTTTQAQALEKITRFITVRMGDLLVLEFQTQPIALDKEMLFMAQQPKDLTTEQIFYCKIK